MFLLIPICAYLLTSRLFKLDFRMLDSFYLIFTTIVIVYLPPHFLIEYLIVFCLCSLSFSDIRNNEIHSTFSYIILICFLYLKQFNIMDNLIQLLLVFLICVILKLLYPEGMGNGDYEFIIIMAVYFPYQKLLLIIIIACLLSVPLALKKGIAPFFPSLCFSVWLIFSTDFSNQLINFLGLL